MANLTGWQAVAREIGDYVCGNEEGIILPGEGSIPGAEHYPPDTPLVGHWLPAEAAAKEILRLRELLREVAVSGVEQDLNKYVVVQISAETWREIRTFAAANSQESVDG